MMKIAKKHGPTVFLLIMVFFMVLAMTLALSLINGGLAASSLRAWPRQFVIAYPIAVPVAFFARIVASKSVDRLTR